MDEPQVPDDDTTDTDERKDPPPPHDEAEQLPDGNYVGEDNIREGRVGGVIGGRHQQGGEGGGG
jgi:hypothetical protein